MVTFFESYPLAKAEVKNSFVQQENILFLDNDTEFYFRFPWLKTLENNLKAFRK